MSDRRRRARTRMETILIAAGLVLLAAWAGIRIHAWYGSSSAVRDFRKAAGDARPTALPGEGEPAGGIPEPDRSLWAEGRVKAWQESLAQDPGRALGVLSIPSIGLAVPIFDGTGELVLNRGIGRIPGTVRPGEHGNVGLAGHRDGFFRGLKDVGGGDRIILETPGGRQDFVITGTRVVDPSEVSVLGPTGRDTLTLVTCYPFYFVGKAPRRFIVTAARLPEDRVDTGNSEGPGTAESAGRNTTSDERVAE